jgi:hypothetical protein
MWAAAAFLAVALVIALYRPSDSRPRSAFDGFARNFAASRQSAGAASTPATPAAALDPQLHSHAKPPPPAALADNVAAQATYDAQATPGDFVTPPSVSIAH